MSVRKKLKAIDRYDIVLVKWRDIVSDSSWVTQEGIDDASTAMCFSVGFFLKMEKDCIKLSGMYDFDNESGSVDVIPIGCLLDITVLGEQDE